MRELEARLSQKLSNLPKISETSLCALKIKSQVAILQSHVFRLEEDIFVFKEISKQSVEQLDIMFDRLKGLAKNQKQWFLLVDLRGVSAPTSEVRAYLKKVYAELSQRGLRFVVLLVGNRIIEFTVKLLGPGVPVPYYCTYNLTKSLEYLQMIRAKHLEVQVLRAPLP